MQKLTKAEEEVMQYLWRLKKAAVSDIIAEIPEPKPAHSTISTIIRILETKGFVDHEAFGRTHVYHPLVSKKEYSRKSLGDILNKYFSGSANQLVSFLLQEGELSVAELDAIYQLSKEQSEEE